MDNGQLSVNTILQTRKDYKPLEDRNLYLAIREDNAKKQKEIDDAAKARASGIEKAMALSTSGLPPRFAKAAQYKIDELQKWVEDGGDPSSPEFKFMIQDVGNKIKTMDAMYKDARDSFGLKEFYTDPTSHVLMTRQKGEDGREYWKNESQNASKGLDEVFFGEYNGEDVTADMQVASQALAGLSKIDKNLPETLRTKVFNELPSLLKETVSGMEDIKNDDYNRAYTVYSSLGDVERQSIIDRIVQSHGSDIAAILAAQKGGDSEVTDEEVVDFATKLIPVELKEQVKTVKDDAQLRQDRLNELYINRAFSKKEPQGMTYQIAPEGTIYNTKPDGGVISIKSAGGRVFNGLQMTIPTGDAYSTTRGGKIKRGATMSVTDGGIYMAKAEGKQWTPVFRGKAELLEKRVKKAGETSEEVVYGAPDASGQRKQMNLSEVKEGEEYYTKSQEDINMPADKVTDPYLQQYAAYMEEVAYYMNNEGMTYPQALAQVDADMAGGETTTTEKTKITW